MNGLGKMLKTHGEFEAEIEDLRIALRKAVAIIRSWHGEAAWPIYYAKSPEMAVVRRVFPKDPS